MMLAGDQRTAQVVGLTAAGSGRFFSASGGEKLWQLRPRFLAAYIAWSAFLSSPSIVSLSFGHKVMPMLADT